MTEAGTTPEAEGEPGRSHDSLCPMRVPHDLNAYCHCRLIRAVRAEEDEKHDKDWAALRSAVEKLYLQVDAERRAVKALGKQDKRFSTMLWFGGQAFGYEKVLRILQ